MFNTITINNTTEVTTTSGTTIITYEKIFNIIKDFPKELVSAKPIEGKPTISYCDKFGKFTIWSILTTDLSAYDIYMPKSEDDITGLSFQGFTKKPKSVSYSCGEGFRWNNQNYTTCVYDFNKFTPNYLDCNFRKEARWNIALDIGSRYNHSKRTIYMGIDAETKRNNPNFIGYNIGIEDIKKVLDWYMEFICMMDLVSSSCNITIKCSIKAHSISELYLMKNRAAINKISKYVGLSWTYEPAETTITNIEIYPSSMIVKNIDEIWR